MKNIATLNALRHQIAVAQTAYRNAIIDNLRESNAELEVLGEYYDEDDGWPKGLHLTILGEADNDPQDVVIDKIKFENKETSKVAVHVCYIDPKTVDTWWSISDLDTDCADLVLSSIQWPQELHEGDAQDERTEMLCRAIDTHVNRLFDMSEAYKKSGSVEAQQDCWNEMRKFRELKKSF